jgi:hypothetical protein
MKPIILNHVLSEKELSFMYNHIISSPTWRVNGASDNHHGFIKAPMLMVKNINETPEHYPLFMWGQTVVYRISKLLEEKKIGIHTSLNRMWFTATYNGKKTAHWPHQDDKDPNTKSIILFMTPIWQPDWRGSFYVDGDEFKFKPGSALIFDSSEYHQGESPESETYNWQRIVCNMLVK